MHHLLAKPVAFLYAPRETLESVGEMLREAGWDASVNPEKRDAAKAVRPGEKMVVLRPLHSKQPAPQEGHQASVVQVLVELLASWVSRKRRPLRRLRLRADWCKSLIYTCIMEPSVGLEPTT